MNRTKKIVKIILIVVASLIGTSVLFFAAMPYLSVFLDPWVKKKEMNNSIVNAGYPGWHEVTLDDHLQIKLPEAWTLVPGERITFRRNSSTCCSQQVPSGKKRPAFRCTRSAIPVSTALTL